MALRPQTIKLEITSRLELIDVVQTVVGRLASLVGFNDETTHYMSVAVRESVTNAIRHGNDYDERKHVAVQVRFGEGTLEVCVSDQGHGFDPALLRNPLADENLLRADGRGIFFMRSFMDEVTFTFTGAAGTTVRMVKRVGSPPVRTGAERL
jgi:serine/threonine-protein kinase RsbW